MKIHNIKFNKFLIPLILFAISIGGLFLFQALAYTPELSHADSVTYDPNPELHPNLLDITYMQDMTEEVCQNSYKNDTKQLIDKRDDKTYWVTKLKDGNCWMTQNLDLDLYANGTNRKLTNEDSDVANWTSTTGASTMWSDSFSNYNMVKYYDPGEYIYTNPTDRLNDGCGLLDSTACANAGWKLTNGANIDSSGNEMTHYLAGNYYSWGAATAGQAASFTTDDDVKTTQSICSRGWQLPADSGDKSYDALLTSYGNKNGLSYSNQDIRLTPLYFVYGGYVSGMSLHDASSQGHYWSSVAHAASYAYYLHLATFVSPSASWHRYFGMSVRCVARGEAVVRPRVPSVDNVVVNINPQISLDVANGVNIEKNETNPSTIVLDAKVSSNQKYSVGISATNPDLTSSTNNVTIPAKSGLLNTAENGWGIKLRDDTEFTALTSNLQTFYTASGAEIKTIPLTIGISTAPDIPNGEYSTDITITATQN